MIVPCARLARRALALSWAERVLFLRAVGWLVLTDLRLRFGASRRMLLQIDRLDEVSALEAALARPEGADCARTYARWIEAAARHLPLRARCLHKSLALHAWLRNDGIFGELHIGVRMMDEDLEAHAWVTVGEYVVNDEQSWVETFTPLRKEIPGGRYLVPATTERAD